ncbi:MAG: hypothetical protein HYZ69_01850 [Candidatus Colwellbacteria bacterium]|nr:hypothetical protein [Candidatus Colwellbacteria bacterium]
MNSYTERLSETAQKVKIWAEGRKNDIYIAALIFLVGMSSFGLGRLSALLQKKEPIRIEKAEPKEIESLPAESANQKNSNLTASLPLSAQGKYVASKSGKAYHFPWCPGALKIKESNRVWFDSKEEAASAGYMPAANCEGL